MAKAKPKKRQVHRKKAAPPAPSVWDEELREVPKRALRNPQVPPPERWDDQELYERRKKPGNFTAGELGEPDPAPPKPGLKNRFGVQGGLGPLEQEGEGNRQTDQFEELEQEGDPDKDLPEE